MGHLVEYEEAQGDKAQALAAILVVRHKNSKHLAWGWARTAAKHAQAAGVDNASDLLGNGRWPKTDALEVAITELGPD